MSWFALVTVDPAGLLIQTEGHSSILKRDMAFVKVFFVVFLGDTGDEGSISRMLREEMFSGRNDVDFKGVLLRDSL